ncbi:GAF domain-containing sensor histidine kinase [Phototrophicus methaneseepsis]|uniref:histidine kinase n=1 Tax=Phototrophicus methaneseepsis TaxID=2710758 RepID=A0A7S8IEW3_9CHLR|nr:GAF domain-containing sensor histidine kinase [Phototrophicus methaneseepsis]QPC82977.1 GAF domain-containing sensor histidine kinase [Phototrophicus methaneseepsis]
MFEDASVSLESLEYDDLIISVRRLLAETDALSSRIAATNEIGIAISRTLDIDEILRVVTKQSKWLLDFTYCAICLKSDDVWTLRTLFGEAPDLEHVNLLETQTIGQVIKTGQSKIIHTGSPSLVLKGYQSQIIIPLTSEREVLGVIIFASKEPNIYSLDDARIAYMLSLQLAGALRNVQAYELIARKEAELRCYAKQLEETNAELDAFAHTIAHDLKTPLTSIVFRSDFIAHTNDDPKLKVYMDQITDSAMKMGQMVDQLLWLARLRDVNKALECVDVHAAVRSVITRFAHSLEQNQVTVRVIEPLPKAKGLTQWVEEVFANLISNAIKYMGEDNPAPSIEISGTEAGDFVRYAVTDSGVGIAADDQARLFEMFTRLHTVNAEGLGLGLSIVHRIVTKLGGSLGVESELGQGSTFWFTLPTT